MNWEAIGATGELVGAPGGQWLGANCSHNYPVNFRTEIDRILIHD